jgi:hypothetical protein
MTVLPFQAAAGGHLLIAATGTVIGSCVMPFLLFLLLCSYCYAAAAKWSAAQSAWCQWNHNVGGEPFVDETLARQACHRLLPPPTPLVPPWECVLQLRPGRITLPGREDRRGRDRWIIASAWHETVPFERLGPSGPPQMM